MIDPETIEEFDDCDGESVHVYGLDNDTGKYSWGWVPLDYVAERGRSDIIDRLFPRYDDEEEAA